jgi:hypothetical protein
MATTDSSNGSKPVARGRGPRGSVLRELLIFGIALGVGVLLMPFLIWIVGNRVLGPYTHGQDLHAGPVKLLGDFFVGLAHGSVIFWCVALGPYFLVLFARLLYAFVRSTPAASAHR